MSRRTSRRILYVCGTLNQTTQMEQVAAELDDHEAWFTPYYPPPALRVPQKLGLLEGTIVGKELNRSRSLPLGCWYARSPNSGITARMWSKMSAWIASYSAQRCSVRKT